jgi:hypothetical protein
MDQHEKQLYALFMQCREISRGGGMITEGEQYGVLILLGQRPVGLWSAVNGRFLLRALANYEPLLSTSTMEEACDVTCAMLSLCRNGWAEGFDAPTMLASAA